VEAVGHLDGGGRTAPRAIGISPGAVTSDDLNAGVGIKPGGQSVGFAIRQQVNGASAFEVNDDRAVALPLALGPVIHA
jgi:hypothetical protein